MTRSCLTEAGKLVGPGKEDEASVAIMRASGNGAGRKAGELCIAGAVEGRMQSERDDAAAGTVAGGRWFAKLVGGRNSVGGEVVGTCGVGSCRDAHRPSETSTCGGGSCRDTHQTSETPRRQA